MKSRVLAVSAVILLVIAIILAVLMHTPPFTVAGDLSAPLKPGASAPLELTISNPHSFPITVTSVTVSIDAVNSAGTGTPSHCASSNFAITQTDAVAALVLAPHSSETLADLGIDQSKWPHIHMIKSSTLQDACKSVALKLGLHANGNFWDNIWSQLAGKK